MNCREHKFCPDKVMMGINNGILFAAFNFCQRFETGIRGREENSVKEGITLAFASEVMIGLFGNLDFLQLVLDAEEIKNLRLLWILIVDIKITLNELSCFGISFTIKKFCLFATCR